MARPASADVTAPPPAKRRNRRVDVGRAAIDVFSRKGYAASSIQDVADSVGVLKGSLYYYISSKEDLLFEIIEGVHHQSRQILDEVLALDVSPIDRFRSYIELHVRWYLDNVEEVTVYFREWRYLTGERLETALEHRRGYEQIIREMISEAQTSGDVDAKVDAKYASFFLLAAVNHVPDWYRPAAGDSAAHIAAAYADLAVGTLRGTDPRSPAPRGGRRGRGTKTRSGTANTAV